MAPDEHAGFLMTMLRMLAFRPERAAAGDAATAAGAGHTAAARPPVRRSGEAFDGDWPALVRQLAVTGAARELARNAALARHAEGALELVVPAAKAHLADRSYVDKLRGALEQHLGGQVALKVTCGPAGGASVAELDARQRSERQKAADQAVQGDHFVRDLVDMFDAKVVGTQARDRNGVD